MFYVITLVIVLLSSGITQSQGCESQSISEVPACSSYIQSEMYFKAATILGYKYKSFSEAPRVVYDPDGSAHYNIKEDTIYVNSDTKTMELFLFYGLALVVTGKVEGGFPDTFLREFQPIGKGNAKP